MFKFPAQATLDEKDARIADLKAEIVFLRSLVAGVREQTSQDRQFGNIEANALLNGVGDEQIELPTLDPRIAAERDALLNGQY